MDVTWPKAQGTRPKRPNNKAKVEDNQLPPIALRVLMLVGWLNFFHARLVELRFTSGVYKKENALRGPRGVRTRWRCRSSA